MRGVEGRGVAVGAIVGQRRGGEVGGARAGGGGGRAEQVHGVVL